MKIEISDEAVEFIKNLSKEIQSQDNRCTASPYFYVIRDTEVQCVPGGHGNEVRYLWDDDLMTQQEIEEYIKVNCDLKDDVTVEDKIAQLEDDGTITPYDVVERYTTPENHNVFLTEKACTKHMESNKHHFKKPQSYIRHAWRNPEMEKLLEVIHEIAKKNS